jgi:hypothetical protein
VLKRRAAAVPVVAALLLVAGGAVAGDPREESRAAFLRGVAEAHDNHFTAARDAFLEAYRLFPHPSILLNLGVARMHTGEYVAAEADLTQFLAEDGGAPPEDLADARATLVAVRRHIGTLRLQLHPDTAHATLDHVPLKVTPGELTDVRAAAGPGELHVEADGYIDSDRSVVVSRDEPLLLDITLKPRAGGALAGAGPGAAESPSSQRHTLLGWSLIGGAGVAVVVGTVAGIEAIVLAHDYNTAGSSGFQSPSTKSEGVAWRTSSDVFFATAIGLAAAGTYFLVVPLPKTADTKAVVSPAFAGVVGCF